MKFALFFCLLACGVIVFSLGAIALFVMLERRAVDGARAASRTAKRVSDALDDDAPKGA